MKFHKRMNTSRLLWLAKRHYERLCRRYARLGKFYLSSEADNHARWYGEKLETLG